MALEPRVGSFANPVADQPGSMVLGDEPADGGVVVLATSSNSAATTK